MQTSFTRVTAEFLTSAAEAKGFPPDTDREVAVVGRSNSGKSSAINAILGQKKLARVSKTPGRTQLINFFKLSDSRRLVDLPGYGFARVDAATKARWQVLMSAYFESRESLAGLMITVDIRRGILALDTTMLQWCESLGIPVCILATKADKLSRSAGLKQTAAIAKQAVGQIDSVIRFSALDLTGIDAARKQLENWLAGAV